MFLPMPRVDKPWGYYVTYVADDHHVEKDLVLLPGQMLSWQYHTYRTERWVIRAADPVDAPILVLGTSDGTKLRKLAVGDEIAVLAGVLHTVINRSMTTNLEIHECWLPLETAPADYWKTGEYDIVRVFDPYSRA